MDINKVIEREMEDGAIYTGQMKLLDIVLEETPIEIL